MSVRLGRHVFGLTALGIGACNIAWHDFNLWEQVQPLAGTPYRDVVVYLAALPEIAGGLAIQWRRTARAGALALGIIYLAYALFTLQFIVQDPRSYLPWGDFFLQFSLACGGIIVYASLAPNDAAWAPAATKAGYYGFAICVVSFTLEQAVYLGMTASLVPKWVPPGQMFWAVATTVAFALAAIALLTGQRASLAAALLTLMLVLFGVLIWFPVTLADMHSVGNWGELTQNFGIAGAAWVVADLLTARRRLDRAATSVPAAP